MRRESAIITLSVCLTIIAASTIIASAGPLDPPAGPVDSTYKTLHEVEPRTPICQDDIPLTISIPGSYYLTQDLFPVGFGDDMITISSDDVTLDLMGFTIVGSSEVSQADDGIDVPFSVTNIAVRNGTIRACIGSGIDASNAHNALYEDLRLDSNSDEGLRAGDGSVIRDCVAANNGGGGIVGRQSVIEGCMAIDNGATGIDSGIRSHVVNCVSNQNARGFTASQAATVEHCVASANTNDGIYAIDRAVIRANQCESNGASGIDVNQFAVGVVIDSNVCVLNDIGISSEGGGLNTLVVRNRCVSNTTDNFDIFGGDVAPIQPSPAGAGPWDNLQ